MIQSFDTSNDIRTLTTDELGDVGGGLNPQPLPPRWSFLFSHFIMPRINFRMMFGR